MKLLWQLRVPRRVMRRCDIPKIGMNLACARDRELTVAGED